MKNRPELLSRRNWGIAMALLILGQSLPWSHKTSGILQASAHWNATYPFGYQFILDQPTTGVSRWTATKENYWFMMNNHFSLAKKVGLGNPFYGDRILYGFFTKLFWFLGPVFAGILVNIAFWLGATFCVMFIARSLAQPRSVEYLAGFLTATGIGFVHSVGEFSPHLPGFSIGFLLLALLVGLKLWKAQSSSMQHLLAYAACGFFQLLGYSSVFFLPLFWLATFLRFRDYGGRKSSFRGIGAVLGFTFGTYFIIWLNGAIQWVGREGSAITVGSYYLVSMKGFVTAQNAIGKNGLLELLKIWFRQGIVDGAILTWAPFLLLGVTLGGFISFKNRILPAQVIFVLFCLQMVAISPLVCSPFTSPFKGYPLYNFAVEAILLAALGLGTWYERGKTATKVFILIFVFSSALWTHLPLIGQRFSLYGFQYGHLNAIQNGKNQAYKIYFIE